MAQLAGKIAVITGGTSGIGAATARLFRDEGATVIVMGNSPTGLDAARAEPGLDAVVCEVGSVGSIDSAMNQVRDRHGRIDVLFANAGMPGNSGPIEAVAEAEFDRVIGVNLRGLFFTVQKALPLMPDGGAIVLTASVGAHGAMADNPVYGASKAGVRSLGRSLAASLMPRRIRVNVLTPGLIRTPIFDKFPVPAAEVIGQLVKNVPMGRPGEPEEAAAVALFLASAAASFVTGAEYLVTGGQSDL